MTTIDTKSWLNFIWSLHNDVRQSRGLKLTGLGALNEINNYLLLFFMERRFDKYSLSDECRFSYLYHNFCSDEKIKNDSKLIDYDDRTKYNHYKVWNHWCNTGKNSNCVLRQMANSELLKKYLKNEVTAICAFSDNCETGKTIQIIINKIYKQFENIAKQTLEIDNVTSEQVINISEEAFGFSAFGDAYEKFKQQATSDSGKTTGQHFTPDIVKEYIVKELKPNNNEIFYEPACGTGGFIHHAVMYVKNNDTDHINFINSLIANECNPEIYKPLAINMLIHGIPFDNIRKQDSLDVRSWGYSIENKIDIIAANPPFGSADPVDPSEYWKILKTGKNVVKDAMGQFIVHMYNSLKNGGRCGTVSDRGIINNGSDSSNSWQTKLRKFLLENCNLYKIVLLPKETFDYTTFSTCILFFVKGEKTKNVEFREIKIKDQIYDGIKSKYIVSDEILGVVNIDKIREKNYSLKYDDYFKVKEEKKAGWIKLGDVCEIKKGQTITITNMIKGIYKVIGGGYIPMKESHSEFNVEENEILISNDGAYAGYLNKFNEKLFITSHCNKIITKNNINKDYLWYYLKLNQQKILLDYQKGQAQPSLNKDKLLNDFQIPNLPLEHQTEIVEFLDEQFKIYDINKLTKQIPLFDLLIRKEYNIAYDLIHLVYRQMESLEELEKIKKDIKAVFTLSVYGLRDKCKMMKLEELATIESGNFASRDCNNSGNIPFYSGKPDNPVGTFDQYTFNYDKYILMIKGGGCPEVLTRINNDHVGMGKVFLVSGKTAVTDGIYCIRLKTTNIKYEYLYYYMTYYKNSILKMAKFGTRLGNIPRYEFDNFQIPIPPLQIQEQIINKIVQLNEQSSYYEQYSKTLQTELELMNETISNLTLYSEEIRSDNPIEMIRNNDIYDDTDKLIKSLKTKNIKIKKVECEVMDV
jgi:type I restriction-modification system DNA methylase subunit/restriction endonuclease S subunit